MAESTTQIQSSKIQNHTVWLLSPTADLLFVVGPAIFVSLGLLVFCAPTPGSARAEMSLGMWLLFVVGIDVAHVWSTLFRTYFDNEERERYRVHLAVIPLSCWVLGVILYSCGPIVFWSVLAYTAVFHFVRQQYGFFSIYARTERDRSRLSREIDTAAVYLGTVYPLLYWHAHLPRSFVWFIEGDFPFKVPAWISTVAGILLIGVLLTQITKEFVVLITQKRFNAPKNLVIWGTVASWYVGIVYFNADVPFTIANVVAHGVPYMALVWIFGAKKARIRAQESSTYASRQHVLSRFFSPRGILLFIGSLLALAYGEEALWDAMVWREHPLAFQWAWLVPQLEDPKLLALIIPLLAVPQGTHYVLDAFIWRIRKPFSELNHLF